MYEHSEFKGTSYTLPTGQFVHLQGTPGGISHVSSMRVPQRCLVAVNTNSDCVSGSGEVFAGRDVSYVGDAFNDNIRCAQIMCDVGIMCIGTDARLYFRTDLSAQHPWIIVTPNNDMPVLSVVHLSFGPHRGKILGLNKETRKLFLRQNLKAAWEPVQSQGEVTSISQMNDGRILGVGLDNRLWTLSADNLAGPWTPANTDGKVMAAIQMRGSRMILGVGMNNELYQLPQLGPGPWTVVPQSGLVTTITQMSDGQIYGVGMDKQIYVRSALASPWVSAGVGTCCATAVAPLHRIR